MSIVTYPLNNINYSAEDAELYNSTRTSGVFASGDNLGYTLDASARTITILPGMAWIKNTDFAGKAVGVKDAVSLAIAAADSVLGRIDRVVLQFSSASNETTLILKQGIAASTPSAPERVATETIYELVLYDISVPAGSAILTDADIIDQRSNETLCGLMRDGVIPLDTGAAKQTVISANITLDVGHANKQIIVNSANDITITIPSHATAAMPDYTEIEVYRYGEGAVYFAGANGVVLLSGSDAPQISEQYQSGAIKLMTAIDSTNNTWAIQGAIK